MRSNQSYWIEVSGGIRRNNISYTGRVIHHPMIHGSTMRTYTPQKSYKNISYTPLKLDEQMYKRLLHQTNSPHRTPPNKPPEQPTMSHTSSQDSSRSASPTLFKQLQADYPWPS